MRYSVRLSSCSQNLYNLSTVSTLAGCPFYLILFWKCSLKFLPNSFLLFLSYYYWFILRVFDKSDWPLPSLLLNECECDLDFYLILVWLLFFFTPPECSFYTISFICCFDTLLCFYLCLTVYLFNKANLYYCSLSFFFFWASRCSE